MISSTKIITLLSCLTLAVQGVSGGTHHGSSGELAAILAAGVLTLLFLNDHSEEPAIGIGHHGLKNGIFGGHHTSNSLFGGHHSSKGLFGGQHNSKGLFGGQHNSKGLFGGQHNSKGLFSGQPNSKGLFGGQHNSKGLFGGHNKPKGLFGGYHTSNSLFGGHGSFSFPNLKNLFSQGSPTRGFGFSHGLGISDTFGLSKPGLFHNLHGSHHGLFKGHKNQGQIHLFGNGGYNRILQVPQNKHKAPLMQRIREGLKNGVFGGYVSNGLFGGKDLHFGSLSDIFSSHKHNRPNFGLFKHGYVPLHHRHSSLLGAKAPSFLESLLS